MKNRSTFFPLAIATAGLLAIPAAHAAVITSFIGDFETGPGPFTPSYGNTVSPANNVLAGLAPSAFTGALGADSFKLESSGGLTVLTDGSLGPILQGSAGGNEVIHSIYATVGNGTGSGTNPGTSITYSLATASALGSVGVYGGWNDSGRDEQNFLVRYSVDNGANWIDLVTIANKGTVGLTITNPIAIRSIIADDSGMIAGGALITDLQFSFAAPLGVENGWTGLSEITAYAVPEPGAAALGLVGALGFLRRRRN